MLRKAEISPTTLDIEGNILANNYKAKKPFVTITSAIADNGFFCLVGYLIHGNKHMYQKAKKPVFRKPLTILIKEKSAFTVIEKKVFLA